MVVISNEIIGKLYTLVYHDRYIQTEEMNKQSILYFEECKNSLKQVYVDKNGMIYEYVDFKKKIGHSLRHNFLVRNRLINDRCI